jgi:hypothetical protein
MPIGGYTYQPAEQTQMGDQQQNTAVSPQEAVRILSMRLPKRMPNSPIPSSLLQSPGGGGMDLTGFIRMLMQAAGTRDQVGPGGLGTDSGAIGGPVNGDAAGRVIPPPHITIGDRGNPQRLPDIPGQRPQPPGDELPQMPSGLGGGQRGVPLF